MSEVAKKNPPAATDGLTENSKQADSITSDDFVNLFMVFNQEDPQFAPAFRTLMRSRALVREIVDCWAALDQADIDHYHGRSKTKVETREKSVIRRNVHDALVLYRECYRGFICREFELLFGVTYEDFEVALNELRDKFGSDGSDL